MRAPRRNTAVAAVLGNELVERIRRGGGGGAGSGLGYRKYDASNKNEVDVESLQARELVEWSRYRPEGRRGCAFGFAQEGYRGVGAVEAQKEVSAWPHSAYRVVADDRCS